MSKFFFKFFSKCSNQNFCDKTHAINLIEYFTNENFKNIPRHSQILYAFFFLNIFFVHFPEHDFSIYPASNIAASAIAASLSGLNWHVRSHISIYDLVDKLAELSESESVSRSFLFTFD